MQQLLLRGAVAHRSISEESAVVLLLFRRLPAARETAGLVRGRRRSEMSNPDNYAVIKSSAKESGPAGAGTRLHIRKRGASNWALPVPEASFDSGDLTWEESLANTVKRSGESVVFSAKDLERLRAEANRILHPIVKNSRMTD
jgi:hypothetical protein